MTPNLGCSIFGRLCFLSDIVVDVLDVSRQVTLNVLSTCTTRERDPECLRSTYLTKTQNSVYSMATETLDLSSIHSAYRIQ